MVRLEVPGELRFRGLVVRAVAAACRLARAEASVETEEAELDLSDEFDAQIVSALSEAFNNIVMHAYGGREPGDVIIEANVEADVLHIRLMDYGQSLDQQSVQPPDLDALPEHGMGLFILRAFVDHFAYKAGSPNVWSLKKILPPRQPRA
jgi:anti-sigma regulatory factor (Ser/Thr protein kinase)